MNILLGIAALVGGAALLKKFKKTGGMKSTSESIEINVPVSTAYNQWTQFEEFPLFMKSVKKVTQMDDTHLLWLADVGGEEKSWSAEITEQIPDTRIAWQSTSGVPNAGVVTFNKISEDRCRVTLQMSYMPQDMLESLGDMAGVVKMEVKANLSNFKELIEKHGSETGAWRGEVDKFEKK